MKMNLKKLICRTKFWIQQVDLMYRGKIKIELLVDKEDFLGYCIETEHYLAELVVASDGFHPYRYVEFIAYDLNREDTSSYAYCYYDNENSTEADIFRCLDEGITYIIN